MADIRWIGGDKRPEDAVGYIAEASEGASGVFVAVLDADGTIHLRAFGDEMTASCLAMIATLLNYRVGAYMFGEDEDEGESDG
jgi:hypothetical protein